MRFTGATARKAFFPIVGGLKNDLYFYNGHEYKLPIHGFCPDRDFSVEQISSSEAVFSLNDDEHTREVYPFSYCG